MIIRKLFKFEGAHIVRNCSTNRCKFSIHGHSYKVEVLIKSEGFDNGQMVMDFGLMKGNIKDLIDSFDHSYSLWDKEADDFKQFIYDNSERWVSLPMSPSAEAYSLMFFKMIDAMLKATSFANGETGVSLHAVRVHETDTGYAEASREDLDWCKHRLSDIVFSNPVREEWKSESMYRDLIKADEESSYVFFNNPVKQQIPHLVKCNECRFGEQCNEDKDSIHCRAHGKSFKKSHSCNRGEKGE